MKAFFRFCLRLFQGLLLFVLLVALFVGWESWSFLHGSPAGTAGVEAQDVLFDVENGSILSEVSTQLEKQGLLSNARYFRLLARYYDMDSRLQAGRFRLNTGFTPKQVLDELVLGKPVLYRLTIREGLSWWEIAELLERNGFARAADFSSIIHDADFLRFYGIPFANAEGFLFPETYLLPKPSQLDAAAARSVAGRLVDTFWRNLLSSRPDKRRPQTAELKQLLTLASIVEKETAVPQERARVAGVYANRLRVGMPLQADPTVIYGLGQSFRGALTRAQLNDSQNPYNTYQKKDLPPGPICSPGLASLKAAAQPEKHDYFYFVAKGNGEHSFSTRLEEHNRAVRQYRENLKKEKKNPQNSAPQTVAPQTLAPQTAIPQPAVSKQLI